MKINMKNERKRLIDKIEYFRNDDEQYDYDMLSINALKKIVRKYYKENGIIN